MDYVSQSGRTRPLILVVEDGDYIRQLVTAVLERVGFDTVGAADGQQALDLFAGRRPALTVLDLGLPRVDGWTVLERIRSWSARPILILSAEDDESAKVRALMKGADDYLAKPFGNAELAARVFALLRRTERTGGESDLEVYDDGLVRVDLAGWSVQVAGEPIALTRLEFLLLAALVRRAGSVVSHAELLREVWGDGQGEGPTHEVKLYIGYLRRKLGAGTSDELIETVRGLGYRWKRSAVAADRRANEVTGLQPPEPGLRSGRGSGRVAP